MTVRVIAGDGLRWLRLEVGDRVRISRPVNPLLHNKTATVMRVEKSKVWVAVDGKMGELERWFYPSELSPE